MAYLKSQGCTIHKLGTASPEYPQVGQVISISGPDGSIPEIDVTHLSSTGKEYIGGLPDFGNVAMEVIWDPAGGGTDAELHTEIWNDFLAQTVDTYQIRLTDSPQTTITFNAYPSQYSMNLAVDDKVGCTISLKVSGAPTLA